jgi:SAM-dependent methyltransferase
MMKRFMLAVSDVGFSLSVGLVLTFQQTAYAALVRKLVTFLFGRLLAPSYHRVITLYGSLYGLALNAGLDQVRDTVKRPIQTIVDCGTGTGFVSQVLAARFPTATIISVDAVLQMLKIAGSQLEGLGIEPSLICADASHLPLGDGSADLVVAQNTMPFLSEFSRVCVPGGAVLFVDSAATLITPVAIRAFRKTYMFDDVVGRPVASGFFILGKRK